MAQEPCQIKFENPSKEGFVQKRSRYLNKWKLRWIVLDGTILYTFKEERNYNNPTETIDLTTFLAVKSQPSNDNTSKSNQFSYGFDINSSQESFSMATQTETERQDWINQINNAIHELTTTNNKSPQLLLSKDFENMSSNTTIQMECNVELQIGKINLIKDKQKQQNMIKAIPKAIDYLNNYDNYIKTQEQIVNNDNNDDKNNEELIKEIKQQKRVCKTLGETFNAGINLEVLRTNTVPINNDENTTNTVNDAYNALHTAIKTIGHEQINLTHYKTNRLISTLEKNPSINNNHEFNENVQQIKESLSIVNNNNSRNKINKYKTIHKQKTNIIKATENIERLDNNGDIQLSENEREQVEEVRRSWEYAAFIWPFIFLLVGLIMIL